MNRPPVYPGGRCGNNSRPHAKLATACPSQGVAREARHSLPGGPRSNFCVGAKIDATATAWVHRVGSTCEHHNSNTPPPGKTGVWGALRALPPVLFLPGGVLLLNLRYLLSPTSSNKRLSIWATAMWFYHPLWCNGGFPLYIFQKRMHRKKEKWRNYLDNWGVTPPIFYVHRGG